VFFPFYQLFVDTNAWLSSNIELFRQDALFDVDIVFLFFSNVLRQVPFVLAAEITAEIEELPLNDLLEDDEV
jgi:hypothetical protein